MTITVLDGLVLVGAGSVSVNGRRLNRIRMYSAGDTIHQGTIASSRSQAGTPLGQVAQLTLDQGRTVAHIIGGDSDVLCIHP